MYANDFDKLVTLSIVGRVGVFPVLKLPRPNVLLMKYLAWEAVFNWLPLMDTDMRVKEDPAINSVSTELIFTEEI